ncbi:MAG: amidohydrolase family protein [Christensenellales bacterium]|jgi:5-methylthioadenosine/S-adenosylhomocysteine deaminase
MSIFIKNGYLITADENDTCLPGCVLVDSGMIIYAGSEQHAPSFKADRVIDAKGGIIAPGFINTHTHIPMNLFRGYADDMQLMDWLKNKIWPAEAKLTADAVYWGSMLAIAELIVGGVTCFSDMYNFTDTIAKAAHESSIRALIASAVIDIDGKGGRRLKEAEAFFDIVRDYERVSAAIGPHAEYTVSPQMFKKVRDMAERLGARVHVHVSETIGEHNDCISRHGKTPIALFDSLGLLDVPVMAAHCVWVDDADMAIMAQKKVHVLSCPRSNLKLGSGIARTEKILGHGINVSVGTDSAASNNNLSMMEEMTLLALLQKGVNQNAMLIPAKTAIKIATINGARALGIDDKTGSLEAGKQADIIIINTEGIRYSPKTDLLNHMVYSGSDADVILTMVGGDILYENGDITFADIDEIKANVRQYSGKIFAS